MTELERRLREERPEAPERLVRMLAERSATSDRRVLVPRLALVGAVTAVMLAALGATGTASYAGVAISSCASTIGDAVHVYTKTSPRPSGNSQTRGPQGHTGNDGKGNEGKSGKGGKGDDDKGPGGKGDHGDDDHDHDHGGGDPGDGYPWQDQYKHKWPVCHKGNTLYLPLPAVVAHLLHGDRPGVCP